MPRTEKKSQQKPKLHPRSKHRERYNFKKLVASSEDLGQYVKPNDYGDLSVNFFDPKAVKALNKALLTHFYGIDTWDIPESYLCPSVPGRADYIHHIADLLAKDKDNAVKQITCMDIGVGANCVYPIIGVAEYGWKFLATETDKKGAECARKTIRLNKALTDKVELRFQADRINIFRGILEEEDEIDITICNPPYFESLEEATAAGLEKTNNLKGEKKRSATSNFGGKGGELWCHGGELEFIKNMVKQSAEVAGQVKWFSTLVSKEVHLPPIYGALKKAHAIDVQTIKMGQGNKISRIVAWRFKPLAWKKGS